MGMDVHDCGSYVVEPSEVGQVSEAQDRCQACYPEPPQPHLLRAGMVLTAEPGIYVRPAPGVLRGVSPYPAYA